MPLPLPLPLSVFSSTVIIRTAHLPTYYTHSHPIDVVKTRLQVSGEGTRNYKALGVFGSVKTIAKEEGPLSFWKV